MDMIYARLNLEVAAQLESRMLNTNHTCPSTTNLVSKMRKRIRDIQTDSLDEITLNKTKKLLGNYLGILEEELTKERIVLEMEYMGLRLESYLKANPDELKRLYDFCFLARKIEKSS